MLDIHIKKQLPHYRLDVQFSVATNELIALFGPSGSGKTTILNCIAGINQPDFGRIQLNETVLFENRQSIIPIQKRKIGYLFQDYALFPHMTVWKNIAYGMKNKDFARSLMEELHIEHLKNKYPTEISGGEKQRVALTRAIATEPHALLLDEPFSSLDDETRWTSQEQLLRIHQLWQIPIILVTHSHIEAEKLSERILYVQEGKLKLQSSIEKMSNYRM